MDDIDQIIALVKEKVPNVTVEQYGDGSYESIIWYFDLPVDKERKRRKMRRFTQVEPAEPNDDRSLPFWCEYKNLQGEDELVVLGSIWQVVWCVVDYLQKLEKENNE